MKVSTTEIKRLRAAYGERDEDAPEILSNPYKSESGFEADTDLTDTEIIPFKKALMSTSRKRFCRLSLMPGWTAPRIKLVVNFHSQIYSTNMSL